MILVTGGNGYVAGYVLKALGALGALAKGGSAAGVRALVRNQAQFARFQSLNVQPVLGDVTNPESLTKAMAGVTQVVHLAAVNRDKGAVTMERVNQQGTINVVNAAKQAGTQHITNLVGLGASPMKPYPLAQTQGIGVDYIVNSGVPYTILEASVIFGAGDEFLNTLAGLARIPPFMVVPGDGRSRFQPIAAQDVAACVVRSLSLTEVKNKRLQICGSEELTLEEIIDAILAEMKLGAHQDSHASAGFEGCGEPDGRVVAQAPGYAKPVGAVGCGQRSDGQRDGESIWPQATQAAREHWICARDDVGKADQPHAGQSGISVRRMSRVSRMP
ncbi:MAG: NAD(P)H-binding protein [Anaerolineae bacterium]|nr:NAD(P)H-binding protein [Anaerolineae bacterium]